MLGLTASDGAEFAVLRQVRGRLLTRHPNGSVEVVADGRGDWVGWIELTTEPITETAVSNTARVIRDVSPDILGVVEAEDRVVLKRFADASLRDGNHVTYPHVCSSTAMTTGASTSASSRNKVDVETIRVARRRRRRPRCDLQPRLPRVQIGTPDGTRLVVLVNHLKSKGFGKQADNNARRNDKPKHREIYRALVSDGTRSWLSWATSTTPRTPRLWHRC